MNHVNVLLEARFFFLFGLYGNISYAPHTITIFFAMLKNKAKECKSLSCCITHECSTLELYEELENPVKISHRSKVIGWLYNVAGLLFKLGGCGLQES